MIKSYTEITHFNYKDPKSDIDYFKRLLNEIMEMTIKIKWSFDEQQADSFNRNFNTAEFIQRLKNILKLAENNFENYKYEEIHPDDYKVQLEEIEKQKMKLLQEEQNLRHVFEISELKKKK